MPLADLCTTKELAARWGVSEQTVRNHVRRGLPTRGRDARGGYLFDPSRAGDWKTNNTGGTGRGGKRAGAGRKRTRPQTQQQPQAVEPIEAGARIAERAASGATPTDAVTREDVYNLSIEELRALVRIAPEESRFTKSEIERLKTMQEARRLHRQNAEAEGKLVVASEFRAEFARQLAAYRERLDTLPERLMRPIVSVLQGAGCEGLGEIEPDLREAMRTAVDRMLKEVSGQEQE